MCSYFNGIMSFVRKRCRIWRLALRCRKCHWSENTSSLRCIVSLTKHFSLIFRLKILVLILWSLSNMTNCQWGEMVEDLPMGKDNFTCHAKTKTLWCTTWVKTRLSVYFLYLCIVCASKGSDRRFCSATIQFNFICIALFTIDCRKDALHS